MSIFKSTFKNFVKNQINARQNLVSVNGDRAVELQKYSAATPWVKMTSFVDYADVIKNPDAKPNKDLAKKYVLMGGTLYPDMNDKTDKLFSLRSGILQKGGAYGTDLGSSKTDKADLQYGIRPMPGITSVNVKSKSAYGSLREATVKFFAWDVKQLEDLLILYMRPGYPVLLEWGWSMYVDTGGIVDEKGNDKEDKNNPKVVNPKVKSFDDYTINCFQENLTQQEIYDAIETNQHKFGGNYEAMLGLIRNYETSMLPNGGFECTTTLISIGDVIDSLKMNSENGEFNKGDKNEEDNEYKDEFESLINAYQYKQDNTSIEASIQTKIKTIKNEALKISDIDTNIYQGKSILGSADIGNSKNAIHSCYIQLAYFIFILNKQKNLYTATDSLLNIEVPLPSIKDNYGEGTCIASTNSMTIDNETCIIKNSSAKIVARQDIVTNKQIPGFLPDVSLVEGGNYVATGVGAMKEYLYGDTNLGIIGNVYINLGKILDIYKNELVNNNGNVYLGKFIKSILKEIEFTLGSINSFDIFTIENKLVIIDKHYVEEPGQTRYGKKFQINILGTDTIVRNQKIVSKIFPSQATIIAIAAQSRENVASLQSSTYSYMNRGLKSRLFPIISETDKDREKEQQKEEDIWINNIKQLKYYVNTEILNFSFGYDSTKNKTTFNTILNSFLVKLDKATNYRAIIPVSLDISIDGIGGVSIGEIFTINKDIVPREYHDKSVGFIVTGISHDISRPDWLTSYQTQFCLLDQDQRQDEVKKLVDLTNAKIENRIKEDIDKLKNSVALYNTFAAFFVDVFNHRYDIKINDNTPQSSISFKDFVYDSSARVKALKAAIEDFKPKYNDVVITYDDFMNEAKKSIKAIMDELYQKQIEFDKNDSLNSKNYKQHTYGVISKFVRDFNIAKIEKPQELVKPQNYTVINVEQVMLGFVNGKSEGFNKYFSEMLPNILSLYKSNQSTALNDIKTYEDSRGSILFRLLDLSSVKSEGVFIPKYMDNKLIITYSTEQSKIVK